MKIIITLAIIGLIATYQVGFYRGVRAENQAFMEMNLEKKIVDEGVACINGKVKSEGGFMYSCMKGFWLFNGRPLVEIHNATTSPVSFKE